MLKNKKIIITFLLICLFIFLGCFLIKYSHNMNKEIAIKYNEKSNIDYKVYLKENDFFETPYLEKNRTYIASLIDYISIDFDYDFNVNSNVEGSYSYYIKGTVSANKNDSDDYYWSKDYVLSEKVTKKYNNTNKINIKAKTKINYQTYNDLLNKFKSQYGLSMDGFLKVSLVIENDIKSDIVDNKFTKVSNVDLNIPLTSLTIEVPIETNDLSNKGTLFSEIIKQNVLFYTIIKCIGYLLLTISFIMVINIVYKIILNSKQENIYNKKLKKILKTYDNIIVNVNKLPNLDSLNIVPVTSFEELIDAHSEVRKPINYIEEKNHSIFILINDGMVWKYDLVKKTSKKREKKK